MLSLPGVTLLVSMKYRLLLPNDLIKRQETTLLWSSLSENNIKGIFVY